jgi:hypothetical protein
MNRHAAWLWDTAIVRPPVSAKVNIESATPQ